MLLETREKESDSTKYIDIYTISVGFNLKYLKLNDTEYFSFCNNFGNTSYGR